MKKMLLTALVIFSNLVAQQADPLSVAKRISERIIKETSFAFEMVEQNPASDVQVIDFKYVPKNKNTKTGFAAAQINLKEEKELRFGISYSSPIKIWVNNSQVFQSKKNSKFSFKETAYSIFAFQDTLTIKLGKGVNNIVVGTFQLQKAVVYMREIAAPEQQLFSQFISFNQKAKKNTWPWCYFALPGYAGKSSGISYPSSSFMDSLFSNKLNATLNYSIPLPEVLKKLVIDSKNTFKKDSYADWNYPNGSLMMSILKLYNAANDKRCYDFVKQYCDFTVKNIPVFKKQYYENHDLHGSYYRIFRKCMLDDSGSPTLPFAEMKLNDHSKNYDALINEMTNYVTTGQARLEDGTLCRPEPEKWTIWADDLFMSVPLIVKYGVLNNQKKYFDDAAKQIINFNNYLFDEQAGLYKHAWFSKTKEKSKIFWGRANGWIIWAESEAMKYIPKNHPAYKKIEIIFKKHLEGILSYQDKSGMWHQILDDKTSFEESSCTAMFIIGLSNAIINGIIDNKYSSNVMNGWNALQKNISEDGIVKDICCGTGIGTNAEFYKTRDRYNNDPRGLGSVIYSAIEVDRLQKYLKNN